MKNKLTNMVLILSMLLFPVAILATGTVSAANCTTGNNAKQQVLGGVATTGESCDAAQEGVSNLFSSIVNILSIIIGFVAVVMIIVSGLKYVTSSGDASKVASAKSTIIYALLGLAIAALAQVLVHMAVNTASGTVEGCKTNPSITASNPACKSP